MKYLFSPEGWKALNDLTARHALFAFDFDGTLAPLAAQPQRPGMPTSIARGFTQLCELAAVAVISHRGLEDLATRLPPTVKYLVGSHGNEGLPGVGENEGVHLVCRAWMEQLNTPQSLEQRHPGVIVDPRGPTLSLHYRMVRDRQAIEQELVEEIGRLQPPARLIIEKCVFHLLPPGAVSRREALDYLVVHESAAATLYVGDDFADEAVFSEAPGNWLTVRVEPSVDSRARFFLHYQMEMTGLLTALVAAVQQMRRKRQG